MDITHESVRNGIVDGMDNVDAMLDSLEITIHPSMLIPSRHRFNGTYGIKFLELDVEDAEDAEDAELPTVTAKEIQTVNEDSNQCNAYTYSENDTDLEFHRANDNPQLLDKRHVYIVAIKSIGITLLALVTLFHFITAPACTCS